MKISYNWLQDYVKTDCTAEEVSDLLTFGGLEVESIETYETLKGGLEGVVVGEVVFCEKHPDADRLSVTRVDVGLDKELDIVCGAPNVAKGQKVAVATVGTKIWTSETEFFEIKKSKIRGKVSEGMICAEDELGLGKSHEGIMVLSADAKTGTKARDYFGIKSDKVFEIGLTPNRSDATSHLGVARDLSAVLNIQRNIFTPLNYPITHPCSEQNSGLSIDVQIDDTENCGRYTGICLSNCKIGESPEWLRHRLQSVGIRPINSAVDISNYVLMELGQPLHFFDAEKIEGQQIYVKKLPQSSKFTTLDGEERTLQGNELMICDAKKGLCMAGVFGGLTSGVTTNTTHLFIESAYFNPVSIRKTAKLHGLKTEASFRYERGCDISITRYALERAVSLLQEITGAVVCSPMTDIITQKIQKQEVVLNYEYAKRLIGKDLGKEIIKKTLGALEMEIKCENEEELTVLVPTNKTDVTRACDLVEEILRIYGYNNIEITENLNSCLSYLPKPNPEKIQNTIANLLSNKGYNEIMNNSLSKSDYYLPFECDFEPQKMVKILNPLSKDLMVMRRTLLFSGLECLVYNLNRKISNQKLYEFGKVYNYNPEQNENPNVYKRYSEENHLSLFLTGNCCEDSWQQKGEKINFYDLKTDIEQIIYRLRIDKKRIVIQKCQHSYFAEGFEIINKDNKKLLVEFGLLSKKILSLLDCKQAVFYGEFNWDLLLKMTPSKQVSFTEIAKFPEVRRDLALVLNKEILFSDIETIAFNCEKKILKSVGLFDIYEGDKIATDKKSYALSFILQDTEKTLTDKQIEQTMSKLIRAFGEQLGAVLR